MEYSRDCSNPEGHSERHPTDNPLFESEDREVDDSYDDTTFVVPDDSGPQLKSNESIESKPGATTNADAVDVVDADLSATIDRIKSIAASHQMPPVLLAKLLVSINAVLDLVAFGDDSLQATPNYTPAAGMNTNKVPSVITQAALPEANKLYDELRLAATPPAVIADVADRESQRQHHLIRHHQQSRVSGLSGTSRKLFSEVEEEEYEEQSSNAAQRPLMVVQKDYNCNKCIDSIQLSAYEDRAEVKINVLEPIFDSSDLPVEDSCLRQGLRIYDAFLSPEECGIVARHLPTVTKTVRKVLTGAAHKIMSECTDRVCHVVEHTYKKKYIFKDAFARHQPHTAPGKLHQDGPKGEHTYDLRVCVRVPFHYFHGCEPSRIFFVALDNGSNTGASHSFLIQAGQGYSITNALGLKCFKTPWNHGNQKYHGMTWIVDFKI
ncbi:hypothetical protein CEUSTIGMA_g9342.t1 [Chlamydomonas eustigma]|uniref:Uncharacterized protein n=1 Tax=Chlamydomonas eustigma TaxID=1157962 RepID=A0A250XFQ8_9CHLO|nr:hypothetical protein CEUSTIGMA_g9342.t1 [Chlamydomonas eustigma]|eukprot:GAX81914.1 hypothetical protein CEUSTIGMA_g9342.t1 [Chlamydomonas eustigma]